jgi:hypothetical protein
VLEVVGQDILGVLPRIPLVANKAVEDSQGHGCASTLTVLNGPGHRGNVLETPFGQKTTDLQVGVNSSFQAPEELQDESVLKDHAGIALFSL